MTTDRIHIEQPRRDWRGRVIPGQFSRRITIDTPPKPLEWIIEEGKADLAEDEKMQPQKKKVAQ